MTPPRSAPPSQRSRPLIALLILITIAAGLWIRSRYFSFPPFYAKYAGDALWAVVVFLGCGFLHPKLTTARLAALSVVIAWSVEFLQLYHTPWLDAVRSTRLGTLTLGNTFNAPDLIAYVIGIGAISLIDSLRITPHRTPAPQAPES